ncbi:hypothetical protein KAW38_04705 [Candidatus Micrarchaeota archaeon]|nr:hypothetical protein [Candidatus Micrarchaeota archaeon]
MGNLNINLTGHIEKIIEYMIRKGYAKTKTEAIRLALFRFDKTENIVPEEEKELSLIASVLLKDIAKGKMKISRFSLSELD